jgi:hypothetical protein
MFAFEYFHFCASGDQLSAEAGYERYDGLHIFLILRFVFDRVLDNEIGGHNEPPLAMLWWIKTDTLACLQGVSIMSPTGMRMRASLEVRRSNAN